MTTETRIDPADWDAAVSDGDGAQVVVAGPGTGKTEFIVQRAAHLISSEKASAEQILILTFSRRSASDIRRRLRAALGRSTISVPSSTFHSFASRLLEAKGTDVLGWKSMPTLLTGPEQVQIVSNLLVDENPSAWPATLRGLLTSRTLASDLTDFLLRCRERRLGSSDIKDMTIDHPDWVAIPPFMERYQATLTAQHRIDYGTLLDAAVSVIDDAGVKAELADQYRYILVDEYQDTSPAQAALLIALASVIPNLTVTGDPYQSIYSFRGASVHNIARFGEDFAPANGQEPRRFVLTTSHRVPAQILDSALAITSGGELPGGAGPVVPAHHNGSVEAFIFDQTSAEAEWIASEIERIHLTERVPLSSLAILLRTKRHLVRELSRALSRLEIPHDPPDQRLVDQPAVQMIADMVLAARAAALAPHAQSTLDAAVRRLLLGPMWRLDLAAERALVRERRRTGKDWATILSAELEGSEPMVRLMVDPTWATESSAIDGFWHLWESLDQITDLAADPQNREFRAAWAAFSQALERQSERDDTISLARYFLLAEADDFEAQPLLSYQASGEDRVTLTTLHQAKGLEFDTVFIADAADSVFPDLRRGVSLLSTRELDPDIGSDHTSHLQFRLQEEMRLAYTAMTRARRRVVWTSTMAGIDERERRPSRFMVTAVGRTEVADLGAPEPYTGPPLSVGQAEAMLRRLMMDPARSLPERLAAITTLTNNPDHWPAERFAGLRERGSDSGVIHPHFSVSPSQGEAYEACPRRYVFERRIGVGSGSSPYLQYGSLIHEVLELSETRALARGASRSDLESMLEVLEEVWETSADFGSPMYNQRWKLKGAHLLAKMLSQWPSAAGVAVELEKELKLEVDGRRWRGFADRIEQRSDGSLTIVDYKTGTSLPTKKVAAESIQLGFYALAASVDADMRKIGPVGGAESWHPAASARSWIREFDMTNIEDLRERMIAISTSLAAEDWTPKPGAACERCPVRIVCPAQPQGREAFVS